MVNPINYGSRVEVEFDRSFEIFKRTEGKQPLT